MTHDFVTGEVMPKIAPDYMELLNLQEELNTNKWSFDRYEYSGDKCFRQSEQWLTTTNKPGEGTVLHFTRFSVQIESLT